MFLSLQPILRSGTIAGLMLGFTLSTPAVALDFTVNPAALGVSDSSFTADSLTLSEVSHIQFTDPFGSFIEHGFAYVTGALSNGIAVATPGLNSDYSIYFQFTDAGQAPTISSGTMDFYAVTGASTFSLDVNNTAQVANTGTPEYLGSANFSGVVNQGATFLSATVTSPAFSFNSNGDAFLGINNPLLTVNGNFFHDITLGGVSFAPDFSSVYIDHNGYDTVSFNVVPENNPIIMMLFGLPLLAWVVRAKQTKA